LTKSLQLKNLVSARSEKAVEDFVQCAVAEGLSVESLFKLLSEAIPGMIYLRSADGRFLMANRIACDLYGLNGNQIKQALKGGEHQQNDNSLQIWPIDQKVISTGKIQRIEEQFSFSNNQHIYYKTTKIPFACGFYGDPSGQDLYDAVLSISIEITDFKLAANQIHSQSNFDPLTGLANRNLLRRRIKQAIVHTTRLNSMGALLFLDLDKFREVNEIFGHLAGDYLLKQVAQTFALRLSEGSVIARLSGDEFALLIPRVNNRETVFRLAEQIIEDFANPFIVESHRVTMNLSIGISFFPDEATNYESILKNTDLALSHAKRSGGHRYCCYTPEMKENISQRRNISDKLRSALDQNQFALFYQPVVSLTTGAVVGMEALLRWVQLEKPFFGPVDFIPIAEQYGLIVPMGEWALRRALEEQSAWLNANPDVYLAVNVSSVQFQEDAIGPTLKKLLQDIPLNPSQLELELTESTIMQDVEDSIHTMDLFHDIGVGIAIDDFGTGYSSLSYLKRFPINKVKIDRSFIKDIGSDDDSEAITRAIVQLGHSLGLRVVAEGVEKTNQLDFLRAISTDLVQGFYYARPMPANMFQEWARSHNRTLKGR